MGVQDLWPILEPVRESVPLYSLSGKTLAVDLSLWVCEAQHVQAMMGRVTKPHLRNLFFRVSSLTLMGIKPVFVMEGEAPKIKAETMSKRTETRFGGFKKNSASKVASNTTRGRFNAVLRECAEMLDYMGVPWVKAAGEAEAMCAYLDSQGLVDGCITNDGDAFLYGARTVYRNFNMNSKDPQVDCYQTSRVHTELQLCRENLVGLAILLGCDYIPKGVLGVGKEHALKYIQSLKGQTLLQKISQWKESNAEVFESVAKKVSHCHVCRHPGSAKAHERGGCVFCDSKRFCEPQDFDYQCPCDWHRHEQTRQALSLETNIRKKTLASPQFPFREIINEFLTSKDKPVSNFKRRQPNMLLMQKFAYDKMEWPRHYTSEKVLVLMTYTELMNRKHGKETTSQIRPIRILKPRVRNAVACLEVIWSKPEHYVFPEDRPTEDQHEVRTVEEESLFSAAFPEVVESYLRDKALAEENKLKKKKKCKKQQPPDVSDDITDLLAQMNLQTLPNATVQKQISRPADSCTGKTEVPLLDTPVNRRQRKNSNSDQNRLDDCPSTPLPNPDSEAAASPSVSAAIDALHLSDIDWDALSFTSSPAPQVSKNENTESGPQLPNDRNVTQTKCEDTERDVRPANTRPASEPCFTESSLRDRVLMKNAAKSVNQHEHSGVVLTQERCEFNSLEDISPCNYTSQPSTVKFTKGGGDVKVTVKHSGIIRDKSQCFQKKSETQTNSLILTAKNQQVNDRPPKKPPQKYKFVKTTSVSSSSSSSSSALSAPKQRCNSCPCPSDKDRKMPQTSKKSVCLSVCSSSEDSDAENQQAALQRKTKIKPVKTFAPDVSLKSAWRSNPSKHTVKPNGCHQPSGLKSHRLSTDVDVNTTPVSTKSRGQDVAAVVVDSDCVFSPASPVTVLDSDDSVVGSDSPLPLAERLRLKFMK